jgi:hypothetical protein
MAWFPCPYLHGTVELTEERRGHILLKHPDLLPEYLDQFVRTLADPDEVRRDPRFPATRLFSRWFENIKAGKFIVVAVVSDPPPEERHWVVTAYIAGRLVQGAMEWKRS